MGFGKDGTGTILYNYQVVTLGTLAARDVAVSGAYPLAEDFRYLKSQYFLDFGTQAVGDNILIGLADGELSSAEVEECIESIPTDRNDNLQNERAMRPVWPLEILGENSAGGGVLQIKGESKPRWTFSDTDGWRWFVYNLDTGIAITTGSTVTIFEKVFGVWVT